MDHTWHFHTYIPVRFDEKQGQISYGKLHTWNFIKCLKPGIFHVWNSAHENVKSVINGPSLIPTPLCPNDACYTPLMPYSSPDAFHIYQPRILGEQGDNALGSVRSFVCPSVHLSVCQHNEQQPVYGDCLCVYNQWAFADNCADPVNVLLICLIRVPGTLARPKYDWWESLYSQLFNGGFGLKIGELLYGHMKALGSSTL